MLCYPGRVEEGDDNTVKERAKRTKTNEEKEERTL